MSNAIRSLILKRIRSCTWTIRILIQIELSDPVLKYVRLPEYKFYSNQPERPSVLRLRWSQNEEHKRKRKTEIRKSRKKKTQEGRKTEIRHGREKENTKRTEKKKGSAQRKKKIKVKVKNKKHGRKRI